MVNFCDAVNHLSLSSAVAAACQSPLPAAAAAAGSSHRPIVAQVHSLSTDQQTIYNVKHKLQVFLN